MPEIICPWDLCIHNTRFNDKAESNCTKDKVKLSISGEINQFLSCGDFKSVISERRTINARNY